VSRLQPLSIDCTCPLCGTLASYTVDEPDDANRSMGIEGAIVFHCSRCGEVEQCPECGEWGTAKKHRCGPDPAYEEVRWDR